MLTENLRIAFGVTVVGLLVGAIAFAISSNLANASSAAVSLSERSTG